jgi:hypothetical protein
MRVAGPVRCWDFARSRCARTLASRTWGPRLTLPQINADRRKDKRWLREERRDVSATQSKNGIEWRHPRGVAGCVANPPSRTRT